MNHDVLVIVELKRTRKGSKILFNFPDLQHFSEKDSPANSPYVKM